ncbi:MAG: hypothetical protein JKY15_06960 [Deltaproteobacteria bacterium]|nr:hypothetical protein [Deltaproteobacteria bacterium]
MRIQPPTQSSVSPLNQPKAHNKPSVSFSSVLDSKQTAAVSNLKNDFQQISKDLKSGKINPKQAEQQFVSLVIAKRSDLNLSEPNLKKIQAAVGEAVAQDPNFTTRLENALKKAI